MVRILFILIASLLLTGCETFRPIPVWKSERVPVSQGKPSLVSTTKTKVVQFGSKFKVYPYEPDHFDMIDLKEKENVDVPFTFFKLKF